MDGLNKSLISLDYIVDTWMKKKMQVSTVGVCVDCKNTINELQKFSQDVTRATNMVLGGDKKLKKELLGFYKDNFIKLVDKCQRDTSKEKKSHKYL